MFDGTAAVVAAFAAAAERAVVAFVVSVECASVQVADFSPRWRSALCIVDVPYLVFVEASAALDPAFWPYLPAVSDISDLILCSLYWELPDVRRQAGLLDALGCCSHAHLQPAWFLFPAPLHAR